jgi:hypothetical protein
MDVSKLDLSALSGALDDYDPDREHYLDLQHGSICSFVFSEFTDESRKRFDEIREALGERYVKIPSMTTQEAYEEAEDFVDSLQDLGVQEELFRALESRGSIRNFRESLLQHPEERLLWAGQRKERSARRLRNFLETLQGLQPGVTAGTKP